MSTTTIRLPEKLKARVTRAAERAGTTPHNFILTAVSEKTEHEEQRAEFMEMAERRFAGVMNSGKTVSWETMRGYLQALKTGKSAARPKPKKLAR